MFCNLFICPAALCFLNNTINEYDEATEGHLEHLDQVPERENLLSKFSQLSGLSATDATYAAPGFHRHSLIEIFPSETIIRWSRYSMKSDDAHAQALLENPFFMNEFLSKRHLHSTLFAKAP